MFPSGVLLWFHERDPNSTFAFLLLSSSQTGYVSRSGPVWTDQNICSVSDDRTTGRKARDGF